MSAKTIEKLLTEALINDGKMYQELYEYELEEQVEELRESLAEDDDDYLFVITENNGHVAMLVLDKIGEIYINEVGREKLKEIWTEAYLPNLQELIPTFAQELFDEELVVNSVKVEKK